MRGDDGIPGGEVARDEAITRFLSKKGCELSPLEGIEFEVISALLYRVRFKSTLMLVCIARVR